MMANEAAIDDALSEVRRIARGEGGGALEYGMMSTLGDAADALDDAVRRLIGKLNVFSAVETTGAFTTRIALNGNIHSMMAGTPRSAVREAHMRQVEAHWRLRTRVLRLVSAVFVALASIPQVYANPAAGIGALWRLVKAVERAAAGTGVG